MTQEIIQETAIKEVVAGDENLYHQPPFIEAINGVMNEPKLSKYLAAKFPGDGDETQKLALHTLLTRIAINFEKLNQKNESLVGSKVWYGDRNIQSLLGKDGKPVCDDLIDRLKENFPYWWQYIYNIKDQGCRNFDGTAKAGCSNQNKPAITYFAWRKRQNPRNY